MAAVTSAMMITGVYPWVPHVFRAMRGDRLPARAAFAEWRAAMMVTALRPAGLLPLPGAHVAGPRPVIVVHGYAMSRASFIPLAARLARAGLGPIFGFDYWSLGRIAAASRRLAAFIDRVRASTGAGQVDVIGHSMGGVVARYLVAFGGGDGVLANLVTIGSPHAGSDVSALGIGHPTRELVAGSELVRELAAAPPPVRTRMVTISSRADALVPGARQVAIAGADRVIYDDLGHVALLTSRRVAREIAAYLG